MLDTKATLRLKMKALRKQQSEPKQRSEVLFHRLRELDFYSLLQVKALYASFRSEVDTQDEITRQIEGHQAVILPRCYGDELRLFRIESLDELHAGEFGIPEPNDYVVSQPDRQISPADVEVFIVPAIAFDRLGNRLGHGKGHYDRLLSQASHNAVKVGICFDCQLHEELPTEPHDIRMDWVITETESFCTRE